MISTKKSLFTSTVALLLCFVMLMGTTFAWFTDEITSTGNIIQAGTLDANMYWSEDLLPTNSDNLIAEGWYNAATTKVFDYNNWEPGFSQFRYVLIENAGSLDFKWHLTIDAEGKVTELAEVIEVYYITDIESEVTKKDLIADNYVGTLDEVLSRKDSNDGTLKSGERVLLAIAFHMQETAGNEYQNKVLCEGGFALNLIAAQASQTGEYDSFDDKYDENAEWPELDLGKAVSVPVGELDADNKTTAPITMSGYGYNVTLPAGVKAADGARKFVFTVDATERSSNINMNLGQVSRSLDVHIDGISENNDVPVIINLGAVLPVNYKEENIAFYHVEDGTPNRMNLVDAPALHNDFSYNSATGEVSIALASFSEVTAVVAAGDPWAGGVDISWYNTTDTVFTITTEDQFAGFAAIVGGMAKDANGNEIWDTFEGKTVKLGADLDLGSKNGKIFTPVGYRFTDDNNKNGISNESKEDISSNVYSFEGIFDGQNHTISNILQRTWDIKGDDPHYSLPNEQYYNDGMGIFGFVYNGTVKNLTVNNFQSDGEFCTTGVVAAYASGTSTFENIKIINSNPRAYNVPNGGVVGYAYNQSGSTALINFNNIEVGASNKITALWGSWDVGCGGILGRVNGDTTVNMTNCTVGAIIDVYNDVCGNYQYYQYRYAGMLVGTVGGDTNPLTGGEKVNFSNVKVYIGNWADYYYCEFEKNSVGSYTEDYQCSRVEKNEINIDPTTNLPYKENLSPCRHQHTENEKKENKNMGTYLPFDQLYTGYGWGSSPVKSADGVEVIKYFYTVTYMDGKGENILATEYVTAGERSESRLWANAHTVKNSALTTNEGKEFVGWMNSNSVKTTSISAGNYKDVLLYESWENPYIIRFVNINGEVVYSEAWTSSNQGLSFTPEVPKIDGYVGSWEDGWQTKLQNVTSDVTIKPVYILEEYQDEDEHVYIDSITSAKDLFIALEDGKSVIMGVDLGGSGKNDFGIKGGKNEICVISGDKDSRLNLNSFELTCDFDHNANKEWHVFEIKDNARLTLSGGVSGDGIFSVEFHDVKSNNVFLFDIQGNGTLVLEAGVNIKIKYPVGARDAVTAFWFNGEKHSFEDYNGIYVQDDLDAGIINIVVGVTTTITSTGVTQN